MTLAELQTGVLAASDVDIRARRLATLDAVSDIELVGIDESAALMWARMRVHLAESGRRLNVNDLWIAASAASRGLPLITQGDDSAPSRASAAWRSSGSDGPRAGLGSVAQTFWCRHSRCSRCASTTTAVRRV